MQLSIATSEALRNASNLNLSRYGYATDMACEALRNLKPVQLRLPHGRRDTIRSRERSEASCTVTQSVSGAAG